jgi:hypothetical protein
MSAAKLFVAIVSDAGAEPKRRMVIHAATPHDAEAIARRRGRADGMHAPIVESLS